MKTLAIDLPEDIAARYEEAARERGISVEELVLASVDEKISRDEEFEQAAAHVLAKNAELHRRLS